MRISRIVVTLFLVGAGRGVAAPVDYLKDVKPLLAARCYACHAALQQKSRFRLDTVKGLLEGGDYGPAVVPGKREESPLLKHVRGAVDHALMPPQHEGERLSEQQIELIAKWIDAGAPAPANDPPDPDPREHWSFRSPKRPAVPNTAEHPIDAFLEVERIKHGLKAQPPADRRLLLRRVSFDLTGLPPTPEQITAFLNDTRPDAYEKLVDKLLASPQYGERWGRHFMDVWRYSEWWGLGDDLRNSQKHIWHWRDWIIDSLNADVGYDEMIRDMLAADERHPTDPTRLRATGFLARQYFKFNRTTWLDETVEHTGKAFLGLTFNCAKCHDHKYDPISQADYYRLRAFFEPYQIRTDVVPGQTDVIADGIPRAFDCNLDAPTYKFERGDDRKPITSRPLTPGLPPLLTFEELKIEPVKLPVEAHSPQRKQYVIDAHLAAAKKHGDEAVQAVELRVEADRLKVSGPAEQFREAAKNAARFEKELAKTTAEAALTKAEEEWKTAPEAKKAEAKKVRDEAKKKADAARKAAENPGEAYTPLVGSVKTAESNVETEQSRTKPFPTTSTGRRTALANWIADRRNPLTARVLVNHLWVRHFGNPLVGTVFDLGRKGTPPTHPELLDWLAVEFMEHGWSLKHLHRLMVTSSAYRMTSTNAGAAENLTRDPENRYVWRQNPARLEAQAIRDALLHLGGQLDLTLGGPSVRLSDQVESKRRSLYFFQSHNDHNKFLSQFDDANVLDCYRRTQSIVPVQALTLSNSKQAISAAGRIAAELNTVAEGEPEFITTAFETLLGASPTDEEVAACRTALADWRSVLTRQKHADPDAKARANLVAALLNHNDFLTVR